MHVGHGRLVGRSDGFDGQKVWPLLAIEQRLQRALDVGLHGAGGEMEDAHVLDVGALAAGIDEGVVRPPEHERREQLLAVPIARERTGLACERPGDVAVVDAVVLALAQPRHALGELVAVVDLDDVRVLAHLDAAADEARRYGVHVPSEVDGAPLAHDGNVLGVRRQPFFRQRQQPAPLLVAPCRDLVGLERRSHCLHEALVLGDADEVGAATQHERLTERGLEQVVGLLDDTVLVRLTGLDARGPGDTGLPVEASSRGDPHGVQRLGGRSFNQTQ